MEKKLMNQVLMESLLTTHTVFSGWKTCRLQTYYSCFTFAILGVQALVSGMVASVTKTKLGTISSSSGKN